MTKPLTESQIDLMRHVAHARDGFYPLKRDGSIVGGMIRRGWMFRDIRGALKLTPVGQVKYRRLVSGLL